MPSNVWSLEDAQDHLSDLLDAVEKNGVQEIAVGSRRFLVTSAQSGDRPSAQEFLAKGGPLLPEDIAED